MAGGRWAGWLCGRAGSRGPAHPRGARQFQNTSATRIHFHAPPLVYFIRDTPYKINGGGGGDENDAHVRAEALLALSPAEAEGAVGPQVGMRPADAAAFGEHLAALQVQDKSGRPQSAARGGATEHALSYGALTRQNPRRAAELPGWRGAGAERRRRPTGRASPRRDSAPQKLFLGTQDIMAHSLHNIST
jgi:hypothetical protein